MNLSLHTSTLFAVAAFAAIPAFGQRTAEQLPPSHEAARGLGQDVTETGAAPAVRRAGMTHGLDHASPAPIGRRTLDPQSPELFTGLSDEEITNAPAPTASFAPDRSRIHYSEQEGGTWVRGHDYKACAAKGGFTFIPFLGADAERNWPVTFRLDSASLGGRALDLDEDAQVRRDGDRFVLDRGPVDVVYDIGHDWVEQSFVLDAAGAEGDLVLELDVKSDLQKHADGAGFQFAGARGGMTYSAAIVLDGAGRTAEVPARLLGDKLSLTVSSDFLRAAQGPIVVDPVISTFVVDDYGSDQKDIEVAYDRETDSYTYVYEDVFSGSDTDIYCTTIRSNGTFLHARYIDSSSEDWANPAIANLHSADKNLIVAQRVNPVTGYSEIVGRILDVPGDTLGPILLIGEATSSWDNFRPDVGGNGSSTPGTVFAVVWEREFTGSTQPRLRTVEADGTLGMVSFFDSGSARRTNVVISQSTGNPSTVNAWNVAYRSVDNATGRESVRGTRFDAGGGILETPADLWEAPLGDTLSDIDVSDALNLDGYDPTYAITFERTPSPQEDTLVIFCRNSVRVSGFQPIELQRREHADLDMTQGRARIGTTATDFVVTYVESDGFSSPTALITTFDLTEGRFIAISERRTIVSETPTLFTDIPMASRFSGGLTGSRYLGLGWSEFNGSDMDAHGARFTASAPFAQAFQYGYGNANSTGDRSFLTMYGERDTVTTKTLSASALPAGSFGFFICGPDFNNVPNPGGSEGVLLVGGSIGRYVAAGEILSSGTDGAFELEIDPTNLPQPTGFVAAAAGDTWQFQAWHRDTGTGGGGPTSNFTNGVTMLFR